MGRESHEDALLDTSVLKEPEEVENILLFSAVYITLKLKVIKKKKHRGYVGDWDVVEVFFGDDA